MAPDGLPAKVYGSFYFRPADPMLARDVWDRTYNDAVTAWHREAGHDMPDLNELTAMGANEPMAFCFPHHFVLPMYSPP